MKRLIRIIGHNIEALDMKALLPQVLRELGTYELCVHCGARKKLADLTFIKKLYCGCDITGDEDYIVYMFLPSDGPVRVLNIPKQAFYDIEDEGGKRIFFYEQFSCRKNGFQPFSNAVCITPDRLDKLLDELQKSSPNLWKLN